MEDYKKLKADYDRISAAAQQKIIAEHVATRDAEIARLKAEVSEARRHAVGVMAAGFNRALDEAGAPPAESPGLRIYAMRDEIAALKAEREQALAANAELRAALEVAVEYQRATAKQVTNADDWTSETVRQQLAQVESTLARPDLGRDVVVVSREVVVAATLLITLLDVASLARWSPAAAQALADLDALLKKGGG